MRWLALNNTVKSFFLGLSYNWRGIDFVRQHKSLKFYVVLPVVLNVLLFVVLAWAAMHFFVDRVLAFAPDALNSTEPMTNLQMIWLGVLAIWRWLCQVVLMLILILVVLLVYMVLTGFVSAPFYDAIAEQTLILLQLKPPANLTWSRFVQDWWRAMKVEVAKLFYLSLPALCLLMLSWIPVIGILFTLVWLIFMAWYFAVNVLVYPLMILGHDLKVCLAFAKQNRLLMLGFGVVTFLPFFGAFMTSFQIVGSALLYVENRK